VICSEFANWDYGAAKTAVQNCLANHPEVNGILSVGDAMTWAAGEVMAAQGESQGDDVVHPLAQFLDAGALGIQFGGTQGIGREAHDIPSCKRSMPRA